MTGENNFLKNIQSCSTKYLTFGDGVKGKVLGICQLDVPRMPKLKDVSFVEGLKANLTSISQLCDDDLSVNFTKGKCMVMNLSNQCVVEGTRSCYLLSHPRTCCRSSAYDTKLWHRRLGHMNFWSL